MWALIRFWSRAADVMLVTSSVMATELTRHACRGSAIALWRRGVDVDIFTPSFRSAEARAAMSGGEVDAPLLVYVGRLGAEKNLTILKGAPVACITALAIKQNLTRLLCFVFRCVGGEPGGAPGAGWRRPRPRAAGGPLRGAPHHSLSALFS